MTKHIPVLLGDVMRTLGDVRGKNIIDATFGAGGYTRALLNAGADVVAFDRDPNVLCDVEKIQSEFGSRFNFIAKPFSAMGELTNKYDAIVFDLGISSMQIDIAERGFSFRGDGPLDMRMSADGMSAVELIATSSVEYLTQILREYGDVKKAAPIAHAIKSALPQTTFALKELIHNPKDVAPVFQALRIAVNDEMGQLRRALAVVPNLLAPNGMCICVSFHSLEDRIVKNTFRQWTTAPGDPRLPNVSPAPFKLVRAATPSAQEVSENPRARSAHMRAVIKSY